MDNQQIDPEFADIDAIERELNTQEANFDDQPAECDHGVPLANFYMELCEQCTARQQAHDRRFMKLVDVAALRSSAFTWPGDRDAE